MVSCQVVSSCVKLCEWLEEMYVHEVYLPSEYLGRLVEHSLTGHRHLHELPIENRNRPAMPSIRSNRDPGVNDLAVED